MEVEIDAGQLLAPKGHSSQTLAVREKNTFTVPKGKSRHTVKTRCFNAERRSPMNGEGYVLTSKKSKLYKPEMSQGEVWGINRVQQDNNMILGNSNRVIENINTIAERDNNEVRGQG